MTVRPEEEIQCWGEAASVVVKSGQVVCWRLDDLCKSKDRSTVSEDFDHLETWRHNVSSCDYNNNKTICLTSELVNVETLSM